MEPVFNNSPETPTSESALAQASASEVKLSDNPKTEDNGQTLGNGDEDTNDQIVERLKEQRDQLRGVNELSLEEKPRRSKLKFFLKIIVVLGVFCATYLLLIKPYLDKPSLIESTDQKSFALPSNIASKTPEEKQALNIISLARQNKPDDIINTYLNRVQLGQSEVDFKALITAYGSSADGEQVELVEKKVGKVDFASTGESSAIAETAAEFDAASLIYKSGYYRHTNNIYLKINLYKPDPTIDTWKMYSFEFKAGDATSPLKADVNIPT